MNFQQTHLSVFTKDFSKAEAKENIIIKKNNIEQEREEKKLAAIMNAKRFSISFSFLF